jgi:flagellar L-ring protein FlgH
MIRMTRTAIMIAAPLLLSACIGGGIDAPNLAFTPIAQPTAAPITPNGAIFQPATGYAPLTSGARAARVGDIVSIILVERTNATTTNSQTSDRAGGIGLSLPTTGPLSILTDSDTRMSGNTEFSGRGAAAQANQLNGEIAVTVVAVHPNGLLEVRGEKRVRINRGDETIQISGLIRPSDIGPDNRVPSTRVANASIGYTGEGEVARASRQGWLQRFFTRVSPF